MPMPSIPCCSSTRHDMARTSTALALRLHGFQVLEWLPCTAWLLAPYRRAHEVEGPRRFREERRRTMSHGLLLPPHQLPWPTRGGTAACGVASCVASDTLL